MRIVESTVEHFIRLQMRTAEGLSLSLSPTQIEAMLPKENARTLLGRSGKPVACLFVHPYWKGVAHAGALISPEALHEPISLTRCARRIIEELEDRDQLWRIQATVRADFLQGRDWLEHLGFACEGRMKAYAPDASDHWLMARVRG